VSLKESIKESKFLVTGGAGFIGSNLVDYLMAEGARKVRVLDNLSNGLMENIQHHLGKENFEFIQGDIRDFETCEKAVEGMDFVSHQAALGSVPRSIQDPITTNAVNISGFLNVLQAAKNQGQIKKMVYAASSSTYGDSTTLPKKEGEEGKTLSPYAITKAVNEQYASVFSSLYGFHTIGLRYFNVFGPKQNPDNPYAAVIPLFCKAVMESKQPVIFGDGKTSRDFTYVENAVQANVRAMIGGMVIAQHEVFNVACGEQISLNDLVNELNRLSGQNLKPIYRSERKGDVKHSLASIDKIKTQLNYQVSIKFSKGLANAYAWYQKNNA
jgi:UDP-N-acetylglucosamine 4-epimerase